ncbi:transposase [Pseudoalteromonas sp. AOP31-A2-14]|uniref:transposase n=1 Tax=Pseudoalteromonas sp. AOP31-A2-14 TaxID=3457695 RepID=UPI00403722A8
MSKHHRAFKLKVAEFALSESSLAIGNRFNVTQRQVRYWTAVYRIHGAESFRSVHKPYSQAFKIEVLKSMAANSWSLSYTSAFFDLSSPGILFQWQKLYARDGISRLQPQKKGRPTMTNNSSSSKPVEQMTEEELREELAYLRAENDVLKKLEALAQARKKKAKTRR